MKLSITGLWRDSEKYINKTLSVLNDISLKYSSSFYFYENDSKDNTRSILKRWMESKDGKFEYNNLGFPKYGSVPDITRIILLSFYRNKLSELIQSTDSDLTLMIDTDIDFTLDHVNQLIDNITNLDAAMVVANTRQHQIKDLMFGETDDSFYDTFALRDKFNNNVLYFTDCPFVLNSDRVRWKNNEPILIKSGFSGLSLIKTSILKKCHWSTIGHSEHVNFCSQVNDHGMIYMIPNCKPKTDIDLSTVDLIKCQESAEKQKYIMSNINKVYSASISSSITIENTDHV
jgi:hypothetical protein